MLQPDRRLARPGELLGSQKEKGIGGWGARAVSPFRKVGISPRWILFERWCAASSIRTQGVWRGSGNQDLTRQMPGCCLLLLTAFCLLAGDGGHQHAMQELPLAA